MQHAVADLLGSALVPELGTDVAARATGNIHLLLIAVAAVGALPHQFAIILDNLESRRRSRTPGSNRSWC